jgi:LysR family transcriptional activator of nhaA
VVRDEIASGTLIEVDRLPAIAAGFFAVTIERRFPNPVLRELLHGEVALSERG